MVQELIRRGANMNTLSKQQCPPLALAIVKVRVAAAAALLAHGASMRAMDRAMLNSLLQQMEAGAYTRPLFGST